MKKFGGLLFTVAAATLAHEAAAADLNVCQTGIIGFTITHGNAVLGGGILVNNVALDLQNSITRNTATVAGGGGRLRSVRQ